MSPMVNQKTGPRGNYQTYAAYASKAPPTIIAVLLTAKEPEAAESAPPVSLLALLELVGLPELLESSST